MYMRLFDKSGITEFIKEYRSLSIYKAIDIPVFVTTGIVISHDLIKQTPCAIPWKMLAFII